MLSGCSDRTHTLSHALCRIITCGNWQRFLFSHLHISDTGNNRLLPSPPRRNHDFPCSATDVTHTCLAGMASSDADYELLPSSESDLPKPTTYSRLTARRRLRILARVIAANRFKIIVGLVISVLLIAMPYGVYHYIKNKDKPPLYEAYHQRELNMPQHNPDLPFPEGKTGKYLFVSSHLDGEQFIGGPRSAVLSAVTYNTRQDMDGATTCKSSSGTRIWHTSLAERESWCQRSRVIYVSDPHLFRFVFDNYTWDRHGPEYSKYKGRTIIPSRIPLTAYFQGMYIILLCRRGSYSYSQQALLLVMLSHWVTTHLVQYAKNTSQRSVQNLRKSLGTT